MTRAVREHRLPWPAVVAALLGCGLAGAAHAQLGDRLKETVPRPGTLIPDAGESRAGGGIGDAMHRSREPRFLNRAQAAERARRDHGGRVLSVGWTGSEYRVKLLRQGEVRIVSVPDAPASPQ
ncbi:hypothetical protein [Algiphilus sp.]|uniref:hypothetical protein n=1 Tax=Algiphilus sp. TaxID=1872431 RepID=UPI0025C328CE|nr:hypothetical protein [Algiphilus sp.]MCK5768879.1 hypothetical protein [Algiphilus sp.]